MLPSSGQKSKTCSLKYSYRQHDIKTQKTTTWIYITMKTANLLPHSLHFSPYIVRGVQLRNMRTGYVV